jgi:hypothetical protein
LKRLIFWKFVIQISFLREKFMENYLELAKNIWKKEEKTIKSLLKFVIRTIKLSLKILTPAKINISAEGGLEDSAETGWLYSIFVLFNSYFEKNKRISLSFTPLFTEQKWNVKGQIIYSFSIASLLFFAFLILITFPYLQTIKCWWRNRKYFKNEKKNDTN